MCERQSFGFAPSCPCNLDRMLPYWHNMRIMKMTKCDQSNIFDVLWISQIVSSWNIPTIASACRNMSYATYDEGLLSFFLSISLYLSLSLSLSLNLRGCACVHAHSCFIAIIWASWDQFKRYRKSEFWSAKQFIYLLTLTWVIVLVFVFLFLFLFWFVCCCCFLSIM